MYHSQALDCHWWYLITKLLLTKHKDISGSISCWRNSFSDWTPLVCWTRVLWLVWRIIMPGLTTIMLCVLYNHVSLHARTAIAPGRGGMYRFYQSIIMVLQKSCPHRVTFTVNKRYFLKMNKLCLDYVKGAPTMQLLTSSAGGWWGFRRKPLQQITIDILLRP